MAYEFVEVKVRLTPADKARLDVMAGARGETLTAFVAGLIDRADREQFQGRAAALVAGRRDGGNVTTSTGGAA